MFCTVEKNQVFELPLKLQFTSVQKKIFSSFCLTARGLTLPLVELVDFWHVAKQDVFLVEQGAGDELSHRRVVHLCRVALKHNGNTLNDLISDWQPLKSKGPLASAPRLSF